MAKTISGFSLGLLMNSKEQHVHPNCLTLKLYLHFPLKAPPLVFIYININISSAKEAVFILTAGLHPSYTNHGAGRRFGPERNLLSLWVRSELKRLL